MRKHRALVGDPAERGGVVTVAPRSAVLGRSPRVDKNAYADNLYHDRTFGIDAVKVLPGEYFATARDMMLVTVLGSCVTACIRDEETGIGGMNHFMLADAASDRSGGSHQSARYGTYAMELLIEHLVRLGARRACLEAKVFGGGNVLQGLKVANIGERNSEFVLRYLAQANIRVAASDLVDVYARRVHYFPRTGRVLVKRFHSSTAARAGRILSSNSNGLSINLPTLDARSK